MPATASQPIYIIHYHETNAPRYYKTFVTQAFINNHPPIINSNNTRSYITRVNITPQQASQILAYKLPITLTPREYAQATQPKRYCAHSTT